jgi:hypothetical protein
MYIKNPETLSNTITLNKIIGKYLINQHKIPILSHNEKGEYVFSKTEKLEEALGSLPWYLKLLNF